MGCVFCEAIQEGSRIVLETEYWVMIFTNDPMTEGHALLMPKRHQMGPRLLIPQERVDYFVAFNKAWDYLQEKFGPCSITGGFNFGRQAGQSVLHYHLHMVPRRPGDILDQDGGQFNFFAPH